MKARDMLACLTEGGIGVLIAELDDAIVATGLFKKCVDRSGHRYTLLIDAEYKYTVYNNAESIFEMASDDLEFVRYTIVGDDGLLTFEHDDPMIVARFIEAALSAK